MRYWQDLFARPAAAEVRVLTLGQEIVDKLTELILLLHIVFLNIDLPEQLMPNIQFPIPGFTGLKSQRIRERFGQILSPQDAYTTLQPVVHLRLALAVRRPAGFKVLTKATS